MSRANEQAAEGMLARLKSLNAANIESVETSTTTEKVGRPEKTAQLQIEKTRQVPEDIKIINDTLINTPDAEKELRRTYRIKKKYINMLKAIQMIEDDKTYADLISEAIELLWRVKYKE